MILDTSLCNNYCNYYDVYITNKGIRPRKIGRLSRLYSESFKIISYCVSPKY